MLNATLVIACAVMACIFIRIIYAYAYKKGCNDTADAFKICRKYIEGMSDRITAQTINRLSRKRNIKR